MARFATTMTMITMIFIPMVADNAVANDNADENNVRSSGIIEFVGCWACEREREREQGMKRAAIINGVPLVPLY